MSNQEQDMSKTTLSSTEDFPSQPASDNQVSNQEEKSLSTDNQLVEDAPVPSEPEKPRRAAMPQDIRYATEHDDRDKLLDKYNNYQVSETNACRLRFLTDHRQKKNLLGRTEGTVRGIDAIAGLDRGLFLDDSANLQAIGKTFDVNFQVSQLKVNK